MGDAGLRLAGLTVFPLKSAGGVPLMSARIGRKGLANDRCMMVVDEAGKAITARAAPRLMQVRVALDGDEVVLFAPERRPAAFRLSALEPFDGDVSVWGSSVSARDGGATVARWLSQHLDRPCRLAVQDDRRPRELDLGSGGIVSLADTAPLLLTNASSLDEINRYLDHPAEMERFRPNAVVTGASAFDEDGWGSVRIGEVEFEVAGACDRCVMITLDASTGAACPDHEPLALLGRQRRGEDGKVYFGQFLIPKNIGRLNVGDPVEVLSRKRPISVMLGTARPATRLPYPSIGSAGPASREKQLTCVGISDETPDLRTLRFAVDPPFSYVPGQFITVLPVIDGAPVRRSYTLSSSPSRPLHVSITVKRADDGLVSRWLHEHLEVGDRLDALGPNGRFHLQAAGAARKLLLLSAGSGVTPMMSMLRFIADAGLDHDVVFHHGARRRCDMPFVEELQALAKQLGPRLQRSWNLTGEARTETREAGGTVHHGRLTAGMMREVCPDFAERTIFCCGPAGFRATAREIHANWQPTPDAPYLEESFGADPDAEELPAIGDYEVVFRKSGKKIGGTGTTTLLSLARQAGIDVSADCEAGICGTCRCRVVGGEWRIAANSADRTRSVLSDREKAENYVLACSTSPIGRVEVEL